MGASGAIIMSFFAAVFATMTLALPLHLGGVVLGLPWLVFAIVALACVHTLRLPGIGVVASERAGRVILWSSIGEGVGLFVAANLVENLGHPEMLLPAMALVVGLHFLPMAYGVPFVPFYVLGLALVAAGLVGLVLAHGAGGAIAGFSAALALLLAAVLAVRRDRLAKTR